MRFMVHPDVLTLARLDLAEWPAARARIRASGHPTCEGDDDGDTDAAAAEAAKAAAEAAKVAAGGDDDDDDAKPKGKDKDDDVDDKVKPGDDWQAKARKHEREAKKLRQERDTLLAAQAERDKEKMSEHERAIAAAREEAANEVTSKFEQERRAERLELAVTKIAVGSGIKVGEGDKEKTVKFADADDVQFWIERQLTKGDLDPTEIYTEDGKVNTDALIEALAGLAASKPNWLAGATNGNGKEPPPDFDIGKGAGSGATGAGSVESEFQKIRRTG